MLNKLTRKEYEARPFSRKEHILLAFIVLAGLALRIAYQWDRSWFGDEVGTIRLIHKSYQYILTHFETWLTMHYFLVMTKFLAEWMGESVLWLGMVPMLAGVAAIPLTARLGSRFMPAELALAAAFLVAVNPYLIQYSCTVRSYSLLVFLSLLAIDRFFAWRNNPGYRQGILMAVIVFFLLMFHINGIYVVASLAFLVLADLISRKDRAYFTVAIKTLAAPVIVSIGLVVLAYLPFAAPMRVEGDLWHDRPPTGISYLPYIFGDYFGNGYLGWIPAFFLAWGLGLSIRNKEPLLVLLPLIIFPVMFMSLQGLSHFPWAYGRFILFVVPILIFFISRGIGSVASAVCRKTPGYATGAFALIIVILWMPGLADLYEYKKDHPWKSVAGDLKSRLQSGDLILCNDDLACIHLEPYFPRGKYPGKLLESFLLKSPERVGDSIFFISLGCKLKATGPLSEYGKIQVAAYPGNREVFLGMIRDDLAETLRNEEIDPAFSYFYKHLYQLNEMLGDRDGNVENYKKWYKCYMLTTRVRNMPASRLKRLINIEEP